MRSSDTSGIGALPWLLEQWMEALANALEALTSERPVICEEAGTPSGEDPLRWREQRFSTAAEPLAWAGASTRAWAVLGSRVLRAAGIDEISSDDARDTRDDLLDQCFSGLARTLSERRGEEVACGAGGEGAPPGRVKLHAIRVRFADGQSADLRVGFDALLAGSDGGQQGPAAAGLPAAGDQPATMSSRTLDLLLDVELPVSVSFGKTTMLLQDILKLSAGSIVELNRSIDDPVELIVNDCVVARGEVVVIEGNYGVRIQQIASRENRLWTSQSVQRED